MLFDDANKGIAQAYLSMLGESHFKVGDKVKCKASGMSGTVTKLDKEHGEDDDKYYTVKRSDGKEMKYAPNELSKMNEAMDPVNKKAVKKKFDDRMDKDIDNDGDVDSSDEYLHKRRKAISKSMAKEDMEIEIDKKKMKKNGDDDDDNDDEDSVVITNKKEKKEKGSMGEASCDSKKMKKEDVDIDEAKDTAKLASDIEAYAKKSGGIDRADMLKVAGMLKKGDMKGAAKYAKTLDTDPRDYLLSKMGMMEDVEQVDELSKKTLGSYAKRASADAVTRGIKYGEKMNQSGSNRKELDKMNKREAGVRKAIDRMTREDVEMDEGVFDSFKSGFQKGMRDSLKKNIKPEHHSKYDFDSIKSVKDRMAMFVKAKKAGHIKEDTEVDEGYTSDVKRAFPASGVKTSASAPKGTSYMPKDKKKAMGSPANKMKKENLEWNWDAILEAPEEEIDAMIEQMTDDELESFVTEFESLEEGNNWYQASTNSVQPMRPDGRETLDPRAPADRAFANAHRQQTKIKDYPGKDKPVNNAKGQAPTRPGENRNPEPMKTLSDIRRR